MMFKNKEDDMDFLELAKSRYSCRSYDDRSVEREKLLSCIDAGRISPSACNSQPWTFILVDDPKTVQELSETHIQHPK